MVNKLNVTKVTQSKLVSLIALSEQCLDDTQRWFGDKSINNLNHQTLGMCGEVGEFANIVKKIDKGQLKLGDATTKIRLAEELADIFTYMLSIAGLLNIDLEKAYTGVRKNNERRFSEAKKERDTK